MTGIERHFSEQAELEREAKRKTLAELRAGVTPILQEIEKLSAEIEPFLHDKFSPGYVTYHRGEAFRLDTGRYIVRTFN